MPGSTCSQNPYQRRQQAKRNGQGKAICKAIGSCVQPGGVLEGPSKRLEMQPMATDMLEIGQCFLKQEGLHLQLYQLSAIVCGFLHGPMEHYEVRTPGFHYDLIEEVRRTGAAVSAIDLLSLERNVREAEALRNELGDGDVEVLQ